MFKALLSIRFHSLFYSMFRRTSKSGKPSSFGKRIAIGLLAVYVIASLLFSAGMLLSTLAPPLIAMGFSWLYFSLVGILAFSLCFIGSIFTTQTHLFEAKDNELLISMPVKPVYILISRITALFLLNLMYTALIFLPAGVVYAIYGAFTFLGVVFYVLGGVLLSVLSLAVSSVFGWIVALISSRLRRKNLISTILMLAFLGAYFYVYSNMQGYIQKLVENGEAIAATIKKTVPPIYNFGMASVGRIPDFLLLAVWCLVPMVVVMYILSRFFLNIATMQRGRIRVKYVKKGLKTSSIRAALLKKELNRFFSLPVYILNCSLGAILILIMGGAVILKWPDLYSWLMDSPATGINLAPFLIPFLPIVICAAISFCSSMTCTSCASISLEGGRFWIIKSMPIDPYDVFYSKIVTNLVFGWPPIIITAAICCIVIPMSAVGMIMIFIVPLLVQFAIAVLGLIFNLWLPKFDWINETVVVKQSASVMLAVFSGMFITAAPYILFYILAFPAGYNVSADLFLLLTALFYLLLSAGGVWYLNTFGKRIYDKI